MPSARASDTNPAVGSVADGAEIMQRLDFQTRSTEIANTYPKPRSVWITRGALGSRSSLRRRRQDLHVDAAIEDILVHACRL